MKTCLLLLLPLLTAAARTFALGSPDPSRGRQHIFGTSATTGLDRWIEQQTKVSQQRILRNIAPFADDPSALPGAVCASPSRWHPDYYYVWTRDAALTMSEVIAWLPQTREEENASNATFVRQIEQTADAYVQFTQTVQGKTSKYGLGEAKFFVDGSVFTGSWCNAQPDGPAARALALIEYVRYRRNRNRPIDPLAVPLIRTDLNYVARVWRQNTHCDVWEESRGLHFYTLAMQRRALHEGAQLMRGNSETETDADADADAYEQAVLRIDTQLARFWDAQRGYVVATLEHSGGIRSKRSNLDAQVLLAALRGDTDSAGLGIASHAMMATVATLVRRFEPLYGVNRVAATDIGGAVVPMGAAVGRYPEDIYDGVGTTHGGNPWSLATSAVAEYHYRLAMHYVPRHAESGVGSSSSSSGDMARYLLGAGDLYMARIARHTAADGTMYEQWTARTGFGRGAVDLTWSYVAHSSAARARARLVAALAA
ncbi:hypothetical protein H4217_000699 [Coemansia sp. RSA 1939]|nr:hypothetical protein H4217_000699 [Coemansia sp. RSA 1939]KAJ2617330.1 hypothetical protein EV177_000627 [Coemansia sp. RSA 1804]KAJ2695170.1 hypothetical protein GGH99_000304 [Coemansia sp. RSA 1285]